MFEKDNIFGELTSKKFDIGDIVWWPELKMMGKLYTPEKEKKFGIISRIEIVFRSNRKVVVAKVIEMGTTNEKDILIVCLNLVSKVNNKIVN